MCTSAATRLRLDCAREVRRITETLRQQVAEVLRRSGIVVAMSGGLDSSVCAALAALAVGPKRVLGLALPERESDPDSLLLARSWAEQLRISFVVDEITPTLKVRRRAIVAKYGDEIEALYA